MMTPQEVSERAFPRAPLGGYNMTMVDEFLDQLTVDYTALYKENASLKAKMKVLADSLEEYRATEKGMRRALLAAQETADEMVREAESRKSELLRDAENSAKAQIAQLGREVADEEARLAAAQAATRDFVARIREVCRKQEQTLDSLNDITAKPAPAGSSVEQTAQDIEESVLKLLEQEDAQAAAVEPEPEPEPEPEVEEAVEEAPPVRKQPEESERVIPYEPAVSRSRRDQERERAFEDTPSERPAADTSPTRRIDFDHLQFGSNYDLK